MQRGYDYESLVELLRQPELLLSRWMSAMQASPMRLPRELDLPALSAGLASVTRALASVVGPDREGRDPVDLRFVPGSQMLRQIEKTVSFTAARFAEEEFSAFDTGALFFSLRDVLCESLTGKSRDEMQCYMEWIVVLAADSLAKGRERAAQERQHHFLDEGTPLIMVSPQLPAVLFVCQPDRCIVASLLARLVFAVVRSGGAAVIIDVRGIAGRCTKDFAEELDTFMGNERVARCIRVVACGVHAGDLVTWREIARRHGVAMHFDNHFDSCVSYALKIGGWHLVERADEN